MDRGGLIVLAGEELHHLVGTMLGAREDEGAGDLGVAQEVHKELHLVGGIDVDHRLRHALGSGCNRGDLDAHRIAQQVCGKAGDLLGHGRREEQVLPFLRQHAGDLADGMDEAEVEHLVHFIEDENLDLGEAQGLALDEIDEAARCRHENVNAVAKVLDLAANADAAEDHEALEPHVLAIGAEAVMDLGREFAGGREDEHARRARCGLSGIAGQALDDRQGKGSGLAGAGLGDAQQVAALEERRDGLGLDGSRRFIAFGLHGLEKRSRESE